MEDPDDKDFTVEIRFDVRALTADEARRLITDDIHKSLIGGYAWEVTAIFDENWEEVTS